MATDVLSFTRIIRVTPTITLSAYVANDSVGGAIALPNAARKGKQSGVIQSVLLSDADSENAAFVVYFFTASPTATDADAFAPTDAQISQNFVGSVDVAIYKTLVNNSVATISNIGLPFNLPQDESTLYAVLQTTGTPTYTAATDLTLQVGILQD